MADFDYNDFLDDIGLDDDDRKEGVSNARPDWYSPRKGQIDRVALVYFHPVHVTAVRLAVKKAKKEGRELSPAEMRDIGNKALTAYSEKLGISVDDMTDIQKLNTGTVQFKKLIAHYQDGLGYVISRLGLDGPEADEVWKKLPEPRKFFTTVLLVYPTDKDGNVDADLLPKKWSVIPWRFGSKIYESIWKTAKSLRENKVSLASQDLLLECKNEEFKNVDVSGAGPALWTRSEKFKDLVLASAFPLYEKIVPFREMSTPDLRAKLGMDGPGNVGSDDFDSILENV